LKQTNLPSPAKLSRKFTDKTTVETREKMACFPLVAKKAVEGRIDASLDSFGSIQNPKSYKRIITNVTEKECGNCSYVLIK